MRYLESENAEYDGYQTSKKRVLKCYEYISNVSEDGKDKKCKKTVLCSREIAPIGPSNSWFGSFICD